MENVKVLGHFYGKNKLICNYHNFYSKIIKFEKTLNIWQQRDLTIFGKNVILSSLINSQLIYNSQIETPPNDFLKSIEKIKKKFLWGNRVPKIAHASLINPIQHGGMNYKDIQSQIQSINVKQIFD